MDAPTILAKQNKTDPEVSAKPGSDRAHNERLREGFEGDEVVDLTSSKENDLHVLLKRFKDELEKLGVDKANIHLHGGPDAVALCVVREALAIGLTMTEGSEAESYRLPLRTMDHRYLENRSRALRSALHGVDDYVWWGGITEQ